MVSHSSWLCFWVTFFMSLSITSYLVMATKLNTATFVETAKKYASPDSTGGARVLLMFDVDGTLKSYKDTNLAIGPWVDKLLQALCNQPGFDVYLNTGKSTRSLIKNYGTIKNLGWYGEHGALHKAPSVAPDSGNLDWIGYDEKWVRTTKEHLQRIQRDMGYSGDNWPGRGKMDTNKLATFTFTTTSKDNKFEALYEKISKELSTNAKVTFHRDSGTLIEVTPPNAHKGTAVEHLKGQVGIYDLALAVGDDERDLEMFQAIEKITSNPFTVIITKEEALEKQAQYCLEHYYELLRMLQKLVPGFTEPFPG